MAIETGDLVVTGNKRYMCIHCGNFVRDDEIYLLGKKGCFCTTCNKKYPSRWTKERIKLYLEYGINKDSSCATIIYIENLPDQLKKEAKSQYASYLLKRKEKATIEL